ncbi:XIAP [Bugula neritina]|uniref:XIAP n=1 Tax=Bugula neritina TaxID=10212 RepID=A0A7J7K7P7_BUGNE|nr:XIAP [Bugula neritina]
MPEDDETFICPQCELRVRNTDPLQGYVSPVEYHISQSPNCPLALTLHDIPGFYPPLDFAVDDAHHVHSQLLDKLATIISLWTGNNSEKVLSLFVSGWLNKSAVPVKEGDTLPVPPSASPPPAGPQDEVKANQARRGIDCRNVYSVVGDQSDVGTTVWERESLGIHTVTHQHPELAVQSSRLATFLTYPQNTSNDVEELVCWGYFYEGKGDSVTCFSCGVVSSDWRRNETVFQRHARSSSNCQFLIGKMRAEAIHAVVRDLGVYEPPAPQDRISVCTSMLYSTIVTTRMLRPRWDSTPVQTALSMGTGREDVRLVVGNRLNFVRPDRQYVADIERDVQISAGEVGARVLSSYQDEVFAHDTSMSRIRERATQLRSQLRCKVCSTSAVGVVFLPCGHLVCCQTCSSSFTCCPLLFTLCCSACAAAMTICPLCRQRITGSIKCRICY